MTCREKLKMEHPECVSDACIGGCAACPHDYGYLDRDKNLCNQIGGKGCIKCWDREIPEPTPEDEKDNGKYAKMSEMLYDTLASLMAAGFSREEAMSILLTMVGGASYDI